MVKASLKGDQLQNHPLCQGSGSLLADDAGFAFVHILPYLAAYALANPGSTWASPHP